MKVAIIHDWLVTHAGAEKVLEQLPKIYPAADLFSLVDFIDEDQRGFYFNLNRLDTASFIQKLPFTRKKISQLPSFYAVSY